MMWERLKNVKLKRYKEHKPTKSILPIVQTILLLIFAVVVLGKFYQLLTESGKPYCDSYGNQMTDCIPCPINEYCIDGKIYDYGKDERQSTKWNRFISNLKSAVQKSLIALFSFGVLVLMIYALNYRKQWIDKQIKEAERFYKQMLLELKDSPTGMIRKSAFGRKFDQNYSPSERKFLQSKVEEIRKIDEQVTFVNDEGELNYIFLSE